MSGNAADDNVGWEKATRDQWKRYVRGTLPGDDTPNMAGFRYSRRADYLSRQPKFRTVPSSGEPADGEKVIAAARRQDRRWPLLSGTVMMRWVEVLIIKPRVLV